MSGRTDSRASRSPSRVPIYCDGKLVAFLQRAIPDPETRPPGPVGDRFSSTDSELKRDIAEAIQEECPHAVPYVRLSVKDGVVVFSGEVENVHDKMALRRIAANMKETVAIMDHVWISCE